MMDIADPLDELKRYARLIYDTCSGLTAIQNPRGDAGLCSGTGDLSLGPDVLSWSGDHGKAE